MNCCNVNLQFLELVFHMIMKLWYISWSVVPRKYIHVLPSGEYFRCK